MCIKVRLFSWMAALVPLLSPILKATTIPRLTLEQLTDSSETIAAGQVTRTWAAWDAEHKYIWTHYQLSVTDSAKGSRVSTVEYAEPGGVLDGDSMIIAGSVGYQVGENVAVFLARMPNGYLRTNGWAQGKFSVDSAGRLHTVGAMGAEVMDARIAPSGSPLRTLEGATMAELKRRVAIHMRTGGRMQ